MKMNLHYIPVAPAPTKGPGREKYALTYALVGYILMNSVSVEAEVGCGERV